MLSAELLKQIQRIELRARYLATDALAGDYLSAFRGQGIEFDEVREYIPGDDVRNIDWHVTARMNHPFVKVYREERERTLMLVIDVSPSLVFTTERQLKREVVAEAAAVLAFLALRNNDKVGLLTFSDHVESYLPPKKGRAHIWRMIQTILGYEGKGKGTDLNAAFERLLKVVRRRSMCFVLSDFVSSGYERTLAQVARRHELVCVRVKDPFESQLPDVGMWTVRDLETGKVGSFDFSSRQVRDRYAKWWNTRRAEEVAHFRQNNIDWFDIDTNSGAVEPLIAFMRRRERTRGSG